MTEAVLPRAGLAEREHVPREHRAGHRARGRIEAPPLGDGQSGGPRVGLGRIRRIGAVVDAVDEPQRAGELGGDGPVDPSERPVGKGHGGAVARAHRRIERASRLRGEALQARAASFGGCMACERCDNALEGFAVSRLGPVRDRASGRERALDEVADDARVGARELAVELRARPRGDRPRLGHAREVVQQLRPGGCGSFVAERDQNGRGALGRSDHARSHLDPARTPARERSHDVLERRDEPARGGDDELDAPVVVMLDVGVDGVDEFRRPWPGELTVEGDDEPVRVMLH